MSTHPDAGGVTPDEPPRSHPQDPAEGADPDAPDEGRAPSARPQDPAEGPDDPETTG